MDEPGSSLRVRPATAADLVRVGQIWAANQDERPSLGSARVPSLYDHELAARELVVAEQKGQVVGFAALLTRGRVRFLADLFVDAGHQSRGVGGHLLRQVLPRQGRPWWTLSSSDPRALSLYLRSRPAPVLAVLPAARPPRPRLRVARRRCGGSLRSQESPAWWAFWRA